MNKTMQPPQNKHSENFTGELPAPQGIGMAVAFDWGLAVQLLAMPFAPFFLKGGGLLKLPGLNGLTSVFVSFLIALPFAVLLILFGEGVRRGWQWTRGIQVAANALLSIVGIVGLWSLWHALQSGHYWGLATSVILVIFSPLIAWRLSRPATKSWFQRVTSVQVRQRHGGLWPWLIALWAIAGGLLQTLAIFLK